MKTDEWIAVLAHPAAQTASTWRQTERFWLPLGVISALLLCAVFWRVDPRWPDWLGSWPYAFKAGVALTVAWGAWVIWRRLLSPTQKQLPVLLGLVMFWAAVVLAGLLLPAHDTAGSDIWQGTWRQCAPSILLLGAPVWLALWRVAKHQAPVHLRTTGAAMGAVAGGVGAVVYSLHCAEFAPMFIVVWYGAGIAASVLLSTWLAPKLLRW